jgi:hypothetical protein
MSNNNKWALNYFLFTLQVLLMDKKYLKAYIIKAEALFQICQFEHSLLIFHRGAVSIANEQILYLHKENYLIQQEH